MPPVYSAAELALIALLAVQAARLIWAAATPVTPLGDWRPAAAALPGAPVDILTGFDPFFRLSGGDAAPGQVTALNLTLYGTRSDDATGRGSAILAGADGVQRSVAIGEEVAPGVRLKAVAFDHVVLARGGRPETLYLDQSGAAPATVGGAPATAAAPAGPLPQLRGEIGFVPRLEAGRISGLVVHPAGSGALFARAGLRDGDVVTAIGGRPVTGPQDIDRVAADFAGGGAVPLVVERGNQTVPLSLPLSLPPSGAPK